MVRGDGDGDSAGVRMIYKCCNCGARSEDISEHLLTKSGWMGVGKHLAKFTGVKFRRGVSMTEVLDSGGTDWYCRRCADIGFDEVFSGRAFKR